jgi:Mg-chelatase subunit ChlD
MMDCRTGSPPGPTSHYDSGTSQATGINAALDVLLDPAVSDPYALKTIVLMSDGKPECIPSTTSCNNARAAAGLLAANEAEDNNISIFSVSYNSPFNATQSAYMEALVRGYGAFYETIDSADLPGIMYEIATNVPVALVE